MVGGRTWRTAGPWLLLGTVWALTVADGFGRLAEYKQRPGEIESAPARWPSDSQISRNAGGATLVLFAHPRCPCTRASLAELARLMSGLGDRLSARVVFLRPTGAAADWDDTDLRQRASSIPGVLTLRDDDGVETARFRARTSGAAVLYAQDGRLLFSGGLTASRGHEGDSPGLRRIRSLLRTGSADRNDAPVFGCSLYEAPPANAVRAGHEEGP
jgi:hypothetical protein